MPKPLRLPVKRLPQHNAGDSLAERIVDLVGGRLMVWSCGAAFTGLMALQEWIRWALELPYYPWTWTIMACATACLAFWKIRVALRELETLKLGLLGERYIGHFLQNKLLPRGYWIARHGC